MLADPKIMQRITELQRAATGLTAGAIDLSKLQQIYIDVLAVDPNELTSLRIGCCRHCWGEGGGYQWREEEYLAALDLATKTNAPLPDVGGGFGYRVFEKPNELCDHCGGEGEPRDAYQDTRYLSPGAKFLFQGVKRTRNGIEIIFGDKQKALENLIRMLGGFNDRVTLTGQMSIAAALAKVEAGNPQDAANAYAEFLRAAPEST